MTRRGFVVKTIAFFLFLAIANPAGATLMFNLTGVNDPNNTAAVSLGYEYAAGIGTIDISITNTSPLYDPRLTAFALNIPDDGLVTGVTSFSSSESGWNFIFGANSINTPGQFGLFDLAAVTGSNFNGGDPNDGIPNTGINTFDFTFVLQGNNLGALTENSIFAKLSHDPPGGANESQQPFLARFQRTGADGEGSDVAAVPEPATMLLLGTGLIGLAGFRRKFKK